MSESRGNRAWSLKKQYTAGMGRGIPAGACMVQALWRDTEGEATGGEAQRQAALFKYMRYV